jgi:hypothetical protein
MRKLNGDALFKLYSGGGTLKFPYLLLSSLAREKKEVYAERDCCSEHDNTSWERSIRFVAVSSIFKLIVILSFIHPF